VWQLIDSNKGGVVAEVEGLKGFVPFSQMSTVSSLPTLTFMDLYASTSYDAGYSA
jgi:small subunit ribosomal protein S1